MGVGRSGLKRCSDYTCLCCTEVCTSDESRNRAVHSHIQDRWRQRTRKDGKNSLCALPAYEYFDKVWRIFTWFWGYVLHCVEGIPLYLLLLPIQQLREQKKGFERVEEGIDLISRMLIKKLPEAPRGHALWAYTSEQWGCSCSATAVCASEFQPGW